jgi:hypothetical protein
LRLTIFPDTLPLRLRSATCAAALSAANSVDVVYGAAGIHRRFAEQHVIQFNYVVVRDRVGGGSVAFRVRKDRHACIDLPGIYHAHWASPESVSMKKIASVACTTFFIVCPPWDCSRLVHLFRQCNNPTS